ncbi:hypothetical protein NKH48_34410 [Mesorhizobium sp. M1233]|uniref:hypothetical protein n=1 Tax=unclassified Mesorhizobium TaxID=325217 RepID=UPI00333D2169
MKAEISHHSYLRHARYSGVYLQQGAMITDRDWNASTDRLKIRIENSAARAYYSGVPRRAGLLAGCLETDGVDHLWSAPFAAHGGWVTAEGVAALALPGPKGPPFNYESQADLPEPPALKLDFLYADIWEETVTAHDDADLADPGLHGAHTAFVSRLRVQIKQCAKDQLVADDRGLTPDPVKLPAIGTGKFAVAPRTGPAGKDACDPCADAVDLERNVGNALFRAEIHDVVYDADGWASEVTIKWSAENGAIQYPRPASTNTLPDGQALEFFNEGHGLLMGMPAGGMADRPARGLIVSTAAGFAGASTALDRIRKWDGYARIDLAQDKLLNGRDAGVDLVQGGDPTAHGHCSIANAACSINLAELVLDLDFSGLNEGSKRAAILTGDYWLAVMRARASASDKVRALSDLPIGIRHHYCVLGQHKGGTHIVDMLSVDKRRLSFPDLTSLDAGDVGFKPDCTSSVFDSPQAVKVTTVAEALRLLCDVKASQISYTTACDYLKGATTVQEALDRLCGRNHWALRMSAGTGQEGFEGETLKGPIAVLVEDQDGKPVAGAKVELATVEPSGSGDELTGVTDPANTGQTITLVSDAKGYVAAWWKLGQKLGTHSVGAMLLNPPQADAGRLWYYATLVERTKSKLATVAVLKWKDGSTFENDVPVSFETFLMGFDIYLTDDVLPEKAVSNDVVIITAERPTKFEYNDGMNFQQLVVCGMAAAQNNQITFVPNEPSLRDLFAGLPEPQPCAPKEGMRFRIRLLGRFIGTKAGLLDGFVPGLPKGSQVHLAFSEAGLGMPSDFEAWVYVGKPPNRNLKFLIHPDLVNVGFTDPARAQLFLQAAAAATSMTDFIRKFKPTEAEKKIIAANFVF